MSPTNTKYIQDGNERVPDKSYTFFFPIHDDLKQKYSYSQFP